MARLKQLDFFNNYQMILSLLSGKFPLESLMTKSEREQFLPAVKSFIKLLRKDGQSLLIGARNVIYNISLPSLQENVEQVNKN